MFMDILRETQENLSYLFIARQFEKIFDADCPVHRFASHSFLHLKSCVAALGLKVSRFADVMIM